MIKCLKTKKEVHHPWEKSIFNIKIQRILINFAGVLGVPSVDFLSEVLEVPLVGLADFLSGVLEARLVDLVDFLSGALEVRLVDLVDFLSGALGGPFDSLLAVFSFGKGSSTYPRWGRRSRSNLVSSAV
jgi:hypothetical protein